MTDPRLYTEHGSCVQPMRRGDIIVGYRRVGVRALLRNAQIEGTTVDVGLRPFGLYIYQDTVDAISIPTSIDYATRQMISRVCTAHSHVSQTTLQSVCVILANLVPAHIQCSGASKVRAVCNLGRSLSVHRLYE